MKLHIDTDDVRLFEGDCIEVMRSLPDASVDSIVTDPPYGLGFMGKAWDALPPGKEWAEECLRVLKPGGHMLAFGGSRTWHRLAVTVEDAGFEIRDSIAWMYGSGFPKSLDVSKAIDKAAGAEREVVGPGRWNHVKGTADQSGSLIRPGNKHDETAPATAAARTWQGWGTALKPAFEPVVVARKPLVGTVAQNVLAHGTGALNIDASRIGTDERVNPAAGNKAGGAAYNMSAQGMPQDAEARTTAGRWPANVILDESQAAELDKQSGIRQSKQVRGARGGKSDTTTYGKYSGQADVVMGFDDVGGASRFFYTAKAGADERPVVNGIAHPTVKPLDLMRWLVRLVTPTGGTVLEPFAGSGTTLEAAVLEGCTAIGIEREADYLPLIAQRLDKPHAVGLDIFGGVA